MLNITNILSVYIYEHFRLPFLIERFKIAVQAIYTPVGRRGIHCKSYDGSQVQGVKAFYMISHSCKSMIFF